MIFYYIHSKVSPALDCIEWFLNCLSRIVRQSQLIPYAYILSVVTTLFYTQQNLLIYCNVNENFTYFEIYVMQHLISIHSYGKKYKRYVYNFSKEDFVHINFIIVSLPFLSLFC